MAEQLHGIILKCIGGFYMVEAADAVYSCRARGIFRQLGTTPMAGDRVRITPQEEGTASLDAVEQRKNSLVRPPVANLDILLVVASVAEPQPNLLVLDKMIALAERQDIEPVIIINKTDLEPPDTLMEIYHKAGFACFAFSALRGDSLAELTAMLSGKVSALTGNSGVGKSSLLNCLLPELSLETGEISRKLGRGRHTTRTAELYPLPLGGYIVDTPGFSSLELDRADWILKEELPACFREFQPYLGRCRYTSCAHVKESGCSILEAVAQGKIAESRHESYVSLYHQVKDRKEWERK